ncbi:hypothetical protein FBR02_05200 [Anaerolineae bacterium CFX9]|jgi:hypothetical protein|nr:hypothetical protein [Anaerolineae bacterium CFX9]
MAIQLTDLHVEYPDMTRHWNPNSEQYAGGDALITALQRGWEIAGQVWAEEYWHGGARLVMIFHFTLERGDETMQMRVLSNPYVRRSMLKWRMNVRPISEREADRKNTRASA